MAQGAIVLAFMAFVALVNSGYTFGRHESKSLRPPAVVPGATAGPAVSGLAGPGGGGGGG
jgi:hypothetical protein